MPTYQYACTDPECGNRFELVQSFTDPSASECPVCQHAVRKVYGSVGVVFKGSGFYRNDSRAAALSAESANNSSSDSSKSESKSDTKSESKSESAKTESKSDSKPKSEKPAAKTESKSASTAASA
jgi:putative FmdB family regulatory protein